jgi:hypothetical protein
MQSDAYNFDNSKVVEFDEKFKEKEKKVEYSQELFKMQIRSYLKKIST